MELIDGEKIKCVLPWKANLGECPVWSQAEQKLYWVDVLDKKIHRFDPSTGTNETFELPEIVACIGLRAKGGLIVALRKNFAFYDPKNAKLELLYTVETGLPQNRFSSGKCDPQGRFWAGTLDAKDWKKPAGNLFRFSANQATSLMQSSVVYSNGIGWSPSGKTMYFTESFRHEIYAYQFHRKSGDISNRKSFIKLDKNSGGFPGSLTVDSEGYVWTNIVGLGQIRRYDPEGNLERIIQMPVSRATSCTFGGPDLKTLYVTSSRETLTLEELEKTPEAGSLFAIATQIVGLPATPYPG